MRVRRSAGVGPRGPSVGAVFRDAPSLGDEVSRTLAEVFAREEDLSLLRAVVAALGEGAPERGLSEDHDAPDEQGAFSAMLGVLETGRYRTLTAKQRAWAVRTAERLDLTWGDPGARNRAVPRGAEVSLLVDSMARPLSPPGRKTQA